MKIGSVLYYRYLFRQAIVLFIVSFILVGTINLVLFLSNSKNTNNIWIFISGIVIWLFPLYLFCLSAIFLGKFILYKNKLQDIELYSMISNYNVRKRVVTSNLRLGIAIPKKNQEQLFLDVIKVEIDKQKKLLSIKRGDFR